MTQMPQPEAIVWEKKILDVTDGCVDWHKEQDRNYVRDIQTWVMLYASLENGGGGT